jgi:hypothetical protein
LREWSGVHGLEGLYLHSHKHYYMTQQQERSSVTQQLRRSEANNAEDFYNLLVGTDVLPI